MINYYKEINKDSENKEENIELLNQQCINSIFLANSGVGAINPFCNYSEDE